MARDPEGARQLGGARRGRDAPVGRKPDRDTRARRHQRQLLQRRAETAQVVVGDRVHDGDAHAFGAQLGDAPRDRLGAPRHDRVVDEAHLAPRLGLQHAHEVGVGHRGERMVAHARLVERNVAHEEIALEHRAPVLGKRGTGDGEVRAERVHQRLGHRPDVAARRRVEGGAVLEVDLARALLAQPRERVERLRDGLPGGHGARLERDHDGVDVFVQWRVRHADRLHRAHPAAHQVVGEIGRSGKVIGNAAKQQPLHSSSLMYVSPNHPCHPCSSVVPGFRGSSIPGNVLITAASSSRPCPAALACMNIWCAVDASGSGNFDARAVSSTMPRSFTKMSTAESGV